LSDVERSLPASPRRRRWAREHGYVARSASLATAVLLGAFAASLMLQGPELVQGLATLVRTSLVRADRLALSTDVAIQLIRESVISAGMLVAWILSGAWCVALAANLAQTGFVWAPTAVAPDISRLDPATGMGRLFSSENGASAAWGFLAILAGVAAATLLTMLRFRELLGLMEAPVISTAHYAIGQVGRSCLELALSIVGLAMIDFVWRRWRLEQSLQMTPDDAKEEADQRRPVARRNPF